MLAVREFRFARDEVLLRVVMRIGYPVLKILGNGMTAGSGELRCTNEKYHMYKELNGAKDHIYSSDRGVYKISDFDPSTSSRLH